MNELTQEFVRTLFDYKDGKLYWKKSYNAYIGKEAGWINKRGYRYIEINGKAYFTHRLVFLCHHGYFPLETDHINGKRDDNRIENLREATRSENCKNTRTRKDNKLGVKNVYYHKASNKYCVRIQHNKQKYEQYVDSLELAELVALEMRTKYHKEFAKHD